MLRLRGLGQGEERIDLLTSHQVFYFGCWGTESGHYLHKPGGRCIRYEMTPWGTKLDGGVQPVREDPCIGHGIPLSVVTRMTSVVAPPAQWTAWAFWDRTVDTRPGSCAAFVADDSFTQTQMEALARQHFPEVWKRLHRLCTNNTKRS